MYDRGDYNSSFALRAVELKTDFESPVCVIYIEHKKLGKNVKFRQVTNSLQTWICH